MIKTYTFLYIFIIIGIFFLSCERNSKEFNSVQKRLINQINNAKYTDRIFSIIDSIRLQIPDNIYLDADPILRTINGGFVLFNQESKNILVFNDQGNFIRKFGSIGDGPGEYRSIEAADVDNDNYIYIYDQSLRRITRFNNNGESSLIIDVKSFDAQVRHMCIDKSKKIYLHHSPTLEYKGFVSEFDTTGYIKTIVNPIDGYESYYSRGYLEGGLVIDSENNIYESNIYSFIIKKISTRGIISEFGERPNDFIDLDKESGTTSMEKLNANLMNSTIIRKLFLLKAGELILLETLKFNQYDRLDVKRKLIIYDKYGTFLGEILFSTMHNFIFSDGTRLFQLWNPPPIKFETEEYNNPAIKIYSLINNE